MSDNVNMIADGVQRLFAGFMTSAVLEASENGQWAGDLWDAIEASGYTKLLLPEEDGGTGGGWADAHPLLYALGYSCVPLPVAETLVANGLLAQAALPVRDGACALIQQFDTGAFAMRLDGERLVLNGEAASIPWASCAARIVIAGHAGSQAVIAVLDAAAPGIDIRAGRSIAGEPLDTVTFSDCACPAFSKVDGALAKEPILVYGALARAAQMSGLLEWVLSQTLTHAKDREQFGRPLIAQQAVKQSLAVLACEAVAADVAAHAACDSGDPLSHRFETGVAKIRSGQAAGVAARTAHQIHGAMGFTYEHMLHHATRRLWSWRAEYGNEARWAQEIGRMAIARGGAAFWPDLTARNASSSLEADLQPLAS